MDNINKYFTIWDSVDDSWLHQYQSNTEWKNHAREKILVYKCSSVLDIGAGTCSQYYEFKNENPHIDYHAIDISKRFVALGQSNGINIKQGSITDMPYKDQEFDGTICLDVLNHQFDYKEQIIEILRVTKKVAVFSFFKPFLEQNPSSEISKYKILKHEDDIVVIEKSNDCAYSFFSKNHIKSFLSNLDINFNFYTHSKKVTSCSYDHNKGMWLVVDLDGRVRFVSDLKSSYTPKPFLVITK